MRLVLNETWNEIKNNKKKNRQSSTIHWIIWKKNNFKTQNSYQLSTEQYKKDSNETT